MIAKQNLCNLTLVLLFCLNSHMVWYMGYFLFLVQCFANKIKQEEWFPAFPKMFGNIRCLFLRPKHFTCLLYGVIYQGVTHLCHGGTPRGQLLICEALMLLLSEINLFSFKSCFVVTISLWYVSPQLSGQFRIVACLFYWCNVLIVFLLYFPAIDANNSGEEEEVVQTRILFILLEFLFDGVGEVQGQTSQPRQAIY